MATLSETRTRHPGVTRIEYTSGRVAYRARPFLHGVRVVLGTFPTFEQAAARAEEYAAATVQPLAVIEAKKTALENALILKNRKLSAARLAVDRLEAQLKIVRAELAERTATETSATVTKTKTDEGDLW